MWTLQTALYLKFHVESKNFPCKYFSNLQHLNANLEALYIYTTH